MSTDFTTVCDVCRRYRHLGQRMADRYSFGYARTDYDGQERAARFVAEHLDHGALRVVRTDHIPEGYQNDERVEAPLECYDVPPLTAVARAFQPGFYDHYKGGRYLASGVVRHSETHEELVLYQHTTAAFAPRLVLDEGKVIPWVRPLLMWSEEVTRDGRVVARFTPKLRLG